MSGVEDNIRPGSWVGHCSNCGVEMIRSRVEEAVRRRPDGPLLCGSCRDAEREADLRDRVAELEAEVARLSRRPDLSPAQAGHLADFFRSHVPASPMHPEDKAITRALAAAAQEATS